MKEISEFAYEDAVAEVKDDLRTEIGRLMDAMSYCADPETAAAKIELLENLLDMMEIRAR